MHASVVAHDMHGPEALNSGTRQCVNRLVVTDVRRYGQRLDAQRPDPLGGARQSPFVYIRQNNVKAVACEPLCEREPNPARRSRHDRDLPSLKFHGPTLSPVNAPILQGRSQGVQLFRPCFAEP